MTTIILTPTHLYAERQVGRIAKNHHLQCNDCDGTNIVVSSKTREDSKITIPSEKILYGGSPILAITSCGSKEAGDKYKNLILQGHCPVKIIEDFRKVDKYDPVSSCQLFVVTEERAYMLLISSSRVLRQAISPKREMSFMGSGGYIGEALLKVFPKIKPLQLMSTMIEHDSCSGGMVDVVNYRSKRKIIKTLELKDLPPPLKDLSVPR